MNVNSKNVIIGVMKRVVVDNGTIKIGLLHSLTGTFSISENPLVSAALLAVDEINTNGGVLGKKLEAIVEDGSSDPATFALKAEKLIKQYRIAAIFGCWSSGSRKAVKDVVEKLNNLLWYPVQYEGLEESPNIIYTGSCFNQQIEPAVLWALSKQKKLNFLLIGSDCVFPHVSSDMIRTIVEEANGRVLDEIYLPVGSHDIKFIASRIKQMRPDMILNNINGDSNIIFFQSLDEVGITPDFCPVLSFNFSENELQHVVREAKGHYTCCSYFGSLDTTGNRLFKEKVQKKYGKEFIVSGPSVNAYLQIHLWRKIVEGIRSFEPLQVAHRAPGYSISGPAGGMEILTNHHVKKYAYIGRANSSGCFDIVWRSKILIDPKPWLGFEDGVLSRQKQIRKALASYPYYVNISSELADEITQRKQIEAELERSEGKYHELVETMNEGILVIDRDNQVIYVNASMVKMLGYDTTEILGKVVLDFLTEQGKATMKSNIELRKHKIASKYECEFVKKDGSTMHASLKAIPQFDEAGHHQGSFTVVEDITEQWKLEQALQESEARYRTIINNMQGGVVLVDGTGRAVFANGKAIEILGYTFEEMSTMTTIDYVAPDETSRIGHIIDDWRNSTVPFVEADCWIVRKDKESRYLHVRVSRLEGDGKSLLVLNDITLRKIAEDKLAALYEDEIKFRRELQAEIDKRIKFTHALVHELKTPLTPIVTGSEMLSRQLTSGTVARLAKNIHTGAEELNNRVEDLLQVARIEVGMLKLNIESVDIRSLIQEAIEYITPLVSNTGHTIDSELSPDLPVISADPPRLRQVLLNLITNAIKYTPVGCIIKLNAMYKDGRVIVEVQDNGPGINEKDKANLFDPYYRMASNHVDFGGLGLGLPISKSIIELHGGNISVESEVNRGSTFRFTLPISGPAKPEGEDNEHE